LTLPYNPVRAEPVEAPFFLAWKDRTGLRQAQPERFSRDDHHHTAHH
jgi:hypothetical protein